MQIVDRFSMENFSRMQEFLARNYREDLALIDEKLFAWQYRAGEGDANVLTLVDGERIHSMLGMVPTEMFWGSKTPRNAVWFMNWIVDRNAPTGAGFTLLRRMLKQYDLYLSSSPSRENIAMTEALGWQTVGYVPRYLYFFGRQPLPTASVEASPLDLESYDPDWEAYSCMEYSAVRSRAFLSWRYHEHPYIGYRVLSDGKRNPSVCAYRIIHAFGENENAKVARILDFFVPDEEEGTFLPALLRELSDEGVEVCEFACTYRPFGQRFLDAGFLLEKPEECLFPKKMTPMVHQAEPFTLQIGERRGGEKIPSQAIHYTLGMGDDDRIASLALLKDEPNYGGRQ